MEDWRSAGRLGDERLKFGAIKIFHGNSLSGRTCWLYEPYDTINPQTGRKDYYGIPPARSQKDLDDLIYKIHAAGFQVACHSNGDREIDMVLNVGFLKSGFGDRVLVEIQRVAGAVHALRGLLKVIIETPLLDDGEKVSCCLLAREAGADFVKTATGFSAGGATVEDVALMRRTVGDRMGVKASGGIRDLVSARQMIAAGATRIGTSSGVRIAREEADAL